MAAASDNVFPKVILVEGSAPAAPPATQFKLYVDSSDHLLKYKNSAGVATTLGAGLADPMTTRGDIIVRNSSNVTARLAVGSNGTFLGSNGTDPSWSVPSGSGGTTITTKDEGSTLSSSVTTLDFVGAGVTASGAGATTTVTIAGGSVNEHNENSAAALTNATSTGDAGSRSDHFSGVALGGQWTQEATALTSGPTVKYSVFGGVAGANACHYVQAYTPSGALRIESKLWFASSTNLGSIGILVRDSSAGDSTGNGMAALYTLNTGNATTLRLLSLDTGTFTSRATAVIDSFGAASGVSAFRYIYIYISRDGSNNWVAGWSFDRTIWTTVNTSYAKTVTIAKAGFRIGAAFGGIDFFDVVT